jgi:hypothetical protein
MGLDQLQLSFDVYSVYRVLRFVEFLAIVSHWSLLTCVAIVRNIYVLQAQFMALYYSTPRFKDLG